MSTVNPFTRALRRRRGPERDPAAGALEAFIAHWDELEALVISVYRAGHAGPADEATWVRLVDTLGRRYPDLAPSLAAEWPGLRAGGRPLTEDPFLALIAIPRAAALVGNRPALELLPAAREALNRHLLARAGPDAGEDP